MELWIRSQDKKDLVKVNSLWIMVLDMSSRKWGYKDTLNKLEELEGVNDGKIN